jgi:predicted MFS family arabinose efflux permease
MTARHATAPRRLATPVAFAVQISIVVALYAASSAPSPLYSVYQAEWGYSSITTTVIFAAYCVSVLLSLLCFGALSDYIGRRPVLLAALLVQAGAMLVFAFADGVTTLFLARFAQGLATGAAIGPVGAGMIDLYKQRGVIANAGFGPMGAGLGALSCGIFVDHLPQPTKLIYFVLAGLFLLQAVATGFSRETTTRRAGALASLKPQFGLPKAVRSSFLLAAPVLVAAWALAGLYGALGPTLVRTLTGNPSHVLGAFAIVAFNGLGGVAVLVMRNVHARPLMIYATSALIVGVIGILVSIDQGSIVGFFASSVLAGTGFGGGYQAGIRSVMPYVAPQERAGVLSIVYVVSYIAMGIPTIALGVRVVHAGVLESTREFGIGAIVLVAIALVGTLNRHPAAATVAPAETELVVEPA